MDRIKNVHFIGIKGVGVAPLAIIAKGAGLNVTGCDIEQEFITQIPLNKNGIFPLIGFSGTHLKNIDLVITTGANGGFDNPEVKIAKNLNIPVLTQGEAVGKFMDGEIINKKFIGISVSGCHGKTTTTAMIATILRASLKDPSFLIGTGEITSLETSGHFGKGEYFVAEADEYATEPKYDKTPKFLWQFPQILLITNIDFDHPDLYSSMKEVSRAYAKLLKNVKGKTIVVNGDDLEIRKITKNFKGKLITFGYSLDNKYVLSDVSIENGMTTFSVRYGSENLGEFKTYAIGEHNAMNALSAVIVGIETGLSIEQVKKGLLLFKGTKRRLEYKGRIKMGAKLYDDYAHHPTEIKKTLKALRQLHEDKKIICIFQPHTYSRTKILFDQFSSSFSDADEIIITNIYASQREHPDLSISSKDLVEKICQNGKNAIFLPLLADVVKYVKEKGFNNDFVLITMGAGDVYMIGEDLIK